MKNNNLAEAKTLCEAIVDAVAAVFVGNKLLLQKLLAAGLSNGHVLFEDYPGLGKTLLVIGHDLDFIFETCARAILLYKGRVVAAGPVRDVLPDRDPCPLCPRQEVLP